jgi:CAAX protease family protein
MSSSPEPLPQPIESVPATPPLAPGQELSPAATIGPPAKTFPYWTGWDVTAVLVAGILLLVAFLVGGVFAARLLPQFRNVPLTTIAMDVRVAIGAQAAGYLVIVLLMYVIVRSRTKEPFGKAIRWNWPGVTAPAFVAAGVVLAIVVDSVARFLPIPKSLPIDAFFHDATSAYIMAAFGISLAPLLEELFFRALLFPVLEKYLGIVASVLLTGAAFASIHAIQLALAWAPVLSIFIVGVVFTVVRWKRNSVAASFLMHCGYNLALFTALWVSSDHFRHLEKAG